MSNVANPYTGGIMTATRDLGAAVLLSASTATLYAVSIVNNQAAAIFVQIFDASATSQVTIGTTNPILEFNLAANTASVINLNAVGGRFAKGIVVASTTGEKGATPSAAGVQCFWVFAN